MQLYNLLPDFKAPLQTGFDPEASGVWYGQLEFGEKFCS